MITIISSLLGFSRPFVLRHKVFVEHINKLETQNETLIKEAKHVKKMKNELGTRLKATSYMLDNCETWEDILATDRAEYMYSNLIHEAEEILRSSEEK